MEFLDSDFTNCPEIPQVLPALVRRESVPAAVGEEIFKMPQWKCFCCRDTGIVRYHLAKRVLRDYNPNRDANPICQRCGNGSKWMHLKGNFDMQHLNKDICDKLDKWDRKNWEETNQQLFENYQKNKDSNSNEKTISTEVNKIASNWSLRHRVRSKEEQSYAQYKHDLASNNRYEVIKGVQNGKA